MKVTVSDVNDNPPKFNKESYSFNVMETNNLEAWEDDAFVGMVTAEDEDVGVNALIRYRMIGGAQVS